MNLANNNNANTTTESTLLNGYIPVPIDNSTELIEQSPICKCAPTQHQQQYEPTTHQLRQDQESVLKFWNEHNNWSKQITDNDNDNGTVGTSLNGGPLLSSKSNRQTSTSTYCPISMQDQTETLLST